MLAEVALARIDSDQWWFVNFEASKADERPSWRRDSIALAAAGSPEGAFNDGMFVHDTLVRLASAGLVLSSRRSCSAGYVSAARGIAIFPRTLPLVRRAGALVRQG